MQRDHAFSLVELLVVVAMIVALLAILLPSMDRAIGIAQNVHCLSQQRQLAQATLALTSDTQGQLPAVWGTPTHTGPLPQQYCWIGKEIFGQTPFDASYPNAKDGALLPYLGGAVEPVRELVRCPALPTGKLGSGVGSNGFFDYTMIQGMSGARLSNVPNNIELRNLDTGETFKLGSRLYTEEDPAHHINGIYKDPGHHSINRMGSWHIDRGGNYAAVDGSASILRFSSVPYGPRADYFWGLTPSGKLIQISGGAYGWWNSQ